MKSDKQLESIGARLLATHAEALKTALLASMVLPNAAQLRGGNDTRWNDAGWYAVIGDDALRAFLQGGGTGGPCLPARDAAGDWYPAETDHRTGMAFRFFHHSAWFELPAPTLPSVLRLAVPYVVMAEALEALSITVSGMALPHAVLPAEHGSAVELLVDGPLLAQAGQARTLHIVLRTPVAAVPALIYPGSSDQRLLSLALGIPTWREA